MEQRYIFTLLAFIGNMVNLFGRDSLRIGVLAIRAEFEACLVNSTLKETERDCGPIVWDDSSVAQLLGSFNYGMVLTMVLGGPLADIAGGKRVMLATTLISSLCTLAVPLLASTSLPLLLTVQVVYGMSGGLVVPALSSMLARWEPVRERGRLATIIYSGSQASAVLAAILTGLATHTLGWRHAFILLGGLPLLWLLPWLLFVSDSPGQQRGISREELHLLLAETSTSAARPSLRDIPVKAILSSGPVWAAVLANAGVAWAAAHTSLLLPQFLAGQLKMPLHHTGVAAALPALGCLLTGLLASLFFTTITRTSISLSAARKLCSSLCLWGFALLSVPMLVFPPSPVFVTVLATSSYSLMGFNLAGAWGSPQDIAPNYVATVMGLVGLACYVVTALVPHTLTLATILLPADDVWPALFMLVAAVTAVANCIFLAFASADLQPWNWREEDRQEQRCKEDDVGFLAANIREEEEHLNSKQEIKTQLTTTWVHHKPLLKDIQ